MKKLLRVKGALDKDVKMKTIRLKKERLKDGEQIQMIGQNDKMTTK